MQKLKGKPMLNDLLFRLRAIFRRPAAESELDEELLFHLENQVRRYTEAGLSREEADPMTFGVVALVLAAVAALASYVPARRAMKVDRHRLPP